MVVTLNKKQVSRILAFASAVVPRKVPHPALECALFGADGRGNVTVGLTDLEQSLVLTLVPAQPAGEPEKFLFPVAELKKLKSPMVALQPTGPDAVVCTAFAGERTFARSIPVPDAADFPDIPALPADMAECDTGAFLRAYRGAAFAAAKDASRLALNGVFAHAEDSVLVATDGHRLTRHALSGFPLSGDAILPLNKVLLKQLPESDSGRIGLFDNANGTQCLALAVEDIAYSCHCRDATYPNYRQVIPDGNPPSSRLTFGPKDLETVESVVPCLDKAMRNALFLFGKADGTVLLGIEGKDGGAPVILPLPECRCADAANLVLAFDGLQLAEALKHNFSELRASDGYSPMVFGDGAGGLHLLMPLRGGASNALLQAAGIKPAVETEPESEAFAPAEPAPEPIPESIQPTPEMEEPAMPEPTAPIAQPRTVRNLEMVTSEDPVARLEELANETLDTVQTALAAVREFKRQIRAAKVHYRTREQSRPLPVA
jgi:DNA polymerase III sliding clamp (beta) subunit (PCNA family)